MSYGRISDQRPECEANCPNGVCTLVGNFYQCDQCPAGYRPMNGNCVGEYVQTHKRIYTQ